MNKKFTKLIAALALLVFMTPTMVGWGQTRESYSLTPDQASTGSNATNYITTLTEFTYNSVSWKMNQWNPKTLQVKTNQSSATSEWRFYNTSAFSGRITQVVITFSALTVSDASKLMFLGGTSEVSATTGGTAGTWNNDDKTLTWTPGASDNFTYFAFYQNGKAASGTNYLANSNAIVVTYETGGGQQPTPTLTLSDSGTGNIGNYATNTAIYRDFTVTQSNLTENILLSANNGGTFTINDAPVTYIPFSEEPSSTEVRWHFTTPEQAGQFTSEITATSGETSATCTYMGYAYENHSVNIDTNIENGTVSASPSSTFYWEIVTLTVTPEQGYELQGLTVVDANNSPVTVTNNSFHMPDSDVTVSATFVEAAPTTTIRDVLNYDFTGISGSSYKDWSDKTGTSGAVYAGNSNAGVNYIQLRTKNNNSGIITTTSGGKISKVSVVWASNNTSGRSLDVYGKNSAYEAPADLYSNSTQGTKLGSITYGTNTELTISNDYTYIGLRSASDAIYLDEIDIDWEVSSTPTCATPTFSPAAGTFTETQSVTISCGTEDATIYYTLDGNDPTTSSSVYSSALSISETTTVKAMAVKDGYNNSTVATATYTIVPPAVATPDFDPAAGTYTATQSVSIACTTEDATIHYTLDGTNPTTSSSVYSEALSISETTTVKAMAVKSGMTDSEVATAIYVILQHAGTEADPYSVADARAAIDANEGITGVYATGIISQVDSYNSTYHSITYWISDDGTTSNQLKVYSGKGLNNSDFSSVNDVEVGATVVVFGNLLYYNTDYEFNYNNYLVSYVAPASITVESTTISATAEGTEGTLNVSYSNITTVAADVWFCNAAGTEGATYDWITASINVDNNVDYLVEPNEDEVRTAYFKVWAYDDGLNEVYSNLVTVTQAEYVAPTPSIAVTPTLVEATADETNGTLTVTYTEIETSAGVEIIWCDENGDALTDQTEYEEWLLADFATDDSNTIEYTIEANDGASRTAYFKVYGIDEDTNDVYSNLVTITQAAYVAPVPVNNYELFSGALVEGDYLIVYNGSAMNNTVNSDRLQYIAVTPENNVISTNDATIVWHIAPSGDYWTIYSAEANAYAASTGAKNKAQMLSNGTDDMALWTVTGTETYDFVNKKNHSNNVNETLRYNAGYGFACYATGTGGALSLYKKVEPTYTLTINGYGDVDNVKTGWNLIASPVATTPENVVNMTSNTFDLYRFNQSAESEWENWKQLGDHYHFNLVPGHGYLYAHSGNGDVTLTFTGTPYNSNGEITLDYSEGNSDVNMRGWNLIGNPFAVTASLPDGLSYYTLNEEGSELAAGTETTIGAMEAIFVQATAADQSVTFTAQSRNAGGNANDILVLNLSSNSNGLIDRAIVRFDEGQTLPKFMINESHTKVYIPQSGKDYAVVNTEAQGEMPVNFKANENGEYTLTVNPENVEMNYLHLIDNMTGADIDLLQTPSYTFNAKVTDYASRFRLVFDAKGNENDNENFAYYNGSVWFIGNEGNATLQVVDMLGHILSSQSVNGNATLNTANLAAGVYVMRLVNNDNVKTQKIVVR